MKHETDKKIVFIKSGTCLKNTNYLREENDLKRRIVCIRRQALYAGRNPENLKFEMTTHFM